uniref:Uncharacterized protein n=1 Tax=Pseudo-nitzschia australis TaxID=44445 RepID=A0A7S4EEF5_9STRA
MQALPLHGPFCGLLGAGIGAAVCAAYKVLVSGASQSHSSAAIGGDGNKNSEGVFGGSRTFSLSVTRSQIVLVRRRPSKSSGCSNHFRARRRARNNSPSDRD